MNNKYKNQNDPRKNDMKKKFIEKNEFAEEFYPPLDSVPNMLNSNKINFDMKQEEDKY